ncbi:hypothetical protein [Kibdelosporangium phytohabitans]|uniref:ParB/Sulfiredoxin domain-containing protein n=1 Tax=Kibdelosporangium phytohabitans TaxID=860235 RepID=A0A0N9HWR5_9PSEU|nr:hypothetical protein [Kibdelosporangium phytohabitans]ALG09841.1 hypothetical protein AOZ06_25700 [Kibdelosporangium phytohabitans]MBE1468770.1 hypothetical protein [Kibdelosporangium phytohabitans]
MAGWLRDLRGGDPDDRAPVVYADAIAALGQEGDMLVYPDDVRTERIVGTVTRAGDFDARFRLVNQSLRARHRSVAHAVAAGIALPRVELIQLGEMYFVVDGHHRVSVARAREQHSVPAVVRRICTTAYAMWCLRLSHLASKAAEREFLKRVPLPDDTRNKLWLDRPSDWARLADAAEAWGFRRGLVGIGPGELAQRWWTDEVVPLVGRLRASGQGVGLRDIELYAADLADRDRRIGLPPN